MRISKSLRRFACMRSKSFTGACDRVTFFGWMCVLVFKIGSRERCTVRSVRQWRYSTSHSNPRHFGSTLVGMF